MVTASAASHRGLGRINWIPSSCAADYESGTSRVAQLSGESAGTATWTVPGRSGIPHGTPPRSRAECKMQRRGSSESDFPSLPNYSCRMRRHYFVLSACMVVSAIIPLSDVVVVVVVVVVVSVDSSAFFPQPTTARATVTDSAATIARARSLRMFFVLTSPRSRRAGIVPAAAQIFSQFNESQRHHGPPGRDRQRPCPREARLSFWGSLDRSSSGVTRLHRRPKT